MQSSGIDANSPIKNVNLLKQEPDFETFCESIHEDVQKHNELKMKYLSNGYSQSMIDEAFADYWQDLSDV
jgi:hypothetical protein